MRERVAAYATIAVHAGAGQNDAEAAPSFDSAALAEDRLAALHGAGAAVGAASPAAAWRVLFQAMMRPGSEVVVAGNVPAALDRQWQSWRDAFGWTMRRAETMDAGALAAAVSPRTQAILARSLGAPGDGIADLALLADTAKRAEVPLVIDNSLATSFLCRPIDFGAAVLVENAAPLISGARDGAAFIVDGGSFDWAGSGRYPKLAGEGEGPAPGNFALADMCRRLLDGGERLAAGQAERAIEGLETLSLRMSQRCRTARAVAEYLVGRQSVGFVSYPGLSGDRYWTLAGQYTGQEGGVALRFGLRAGAAAQARLVSSLQLVGTEAGLGSSRSSVFADDGRGLVFAAGLEDAADVIADLEQGLD